MCGSMRYSDAETTLPATCRAVSSELHCAASLKLARRNDHFNSLSTRYELMVHHTVDVKKCNEHHFFLGFDEA